MLISYKRGQTSVVLRVKIYDSSVTTGAGKTGLAYNTSGLKIATIADNEATTTVYTVAGSTVEDITTLGTFATPTATKCRFKEVDATNHPGVYEIHIANARFAVTSAKSLMVSISGATNAAECDVLIPLVDFDPYGASTSNISFAGGVTITQSTTNGAGLSITGNGSGAGILTTGGDTGIGLSTVGGGTSGYGMKVTGTSDNALYISSNGGNGHGIYARGQGNGIGLKLEAGATGVGLTIAGGSTSGAGITVTTTSGNGITVAPGGGNGHALSLAGNGSGVGFKIIGGATGIGLDCRGGTTSGNGVFITATSGRGVYITAGGIANEGVQIAGIGGGAGLALVGGATGPGMTVTGGSTSGKGIYVTTTNGTGIDVTTTAGYGTYISSGSTVGSLFTGATNAIQVLGSSGAAITVTGGSNGAAIALAGTGTGAGLSATGGATGNGVTIVGGGTSGNGLNITTTSGHGVSITGLGTNKDGIVSVGARYDINADIQGSLSGAVTLATPVGLKKNTAVTAFTFVMIDETDHATPLAGLTVTATRSLDGAAFASCANAVSEIGNGVYKINLATTDMDADVVTLKFAATGADVRILTIFTEE